MSLSLLNYFIDNQTLNYIANINFKPHPLELDQAGLPEKIINEAGQEKSFKYYRRGNAVQITDTDGSTLQISYHDDFNAPVEIRGNWGQIQIKIDILNQ